MLELGSGSLKDTSAYVAFAMFAFVEVSGLLLNVDIFPSNSAAYDEVSFLYVQVYF